MRLQTSIAANQGAVNRDDPNWERSDNSIGAYSHSKIAFGLFGLELNRSSQTAGWAITALSRLRVIGTIASAGESALMAATTPGDQAGKFFGPNGFRGLGGKPADRSSTHTYAGPTTRNECGTSPNNSRKSASRATAQLDERHCCPVHRPATERATTRHFPSGDEERGQSSISKPFPSCGRDRTSIAVERIDDFFVGFADSYG